MHSVGSYACTTSPLMYYIRLHEGAESKFFTTNTHVFKVHIMNIISASFYHVSWSSVVSSCLYPHTQSARVQYLRYITARPCRLSGQTFLLARLVQHQHVNTDTCYGCSECSAVCYGKWIHMNLNYETYPFSRHLIF